MLEGIVAVAGVVPPSGSEAPDAVEIRAIVGGGMDHPASSRLTETEQTGFEPGPPDPQDCTRLRLRMAEHHGKA